MCSILITPIDDLLIDCQPLVGSRFVSISCSALDGGVDIDSATCSFDGAPAENCK